MEGGRKQLAIQDDGESNGQIHSSTMAETLQNL
jgi:hypothetical protein